MSSFIIKAHENRPLPPEWQTDAGCVFCKIIRGEAPAYKLYETDRVVAILVRPSYNSDCRRGPGLRAPRARGPADIMPLRPGHALVIPKVHISRVSELPDEFAAECGKAVSRVARAISAAVENTGLNVVCNQEYAQAVFHVHYHIIPAPRPGESTQEDEGDRVTRPLTHKEMHKLEYQSRTRLEESAAKQLVESIRARL
ncbi:HIT-like protein [Trametes polyzona]|nr:HIT-like protein [Trametes polyzona]